jgi:hypothetical protein
MSAIGTALHGFAYLNRTTKGVTSREIKRISGSGSIAVEVCRHTVEQTSSRSKSHTFTDPSANL